VPPASFGCRKRPWRSDRVARSVPACHHHHTQCLRHPARLSCYPAGREL